MAVSTSNGNEHSANDDQATQKTEDGNIEPWEDARTFLRPNANTTTLHTFLVIISLP